MKIRVVFSGGNEIPDHLQNPETMRFKDENAKLSESERELNYQKYSAAMQTFEDKFALDEDRLVAELDIVNGTCELLPAEEFRGKV